MSRKRPWDESGGVAARGCSGSGEDSPAASVGPWPNTARCGSLTHFGPSMMSFHEAEFSCWRSRSRSATCAASSSCNDSSIPRAALAVSESLRPSLSSLATIPSCRETCFWLSATCRSANFKRCSITARFIDCYSGSGRLQKVYPSIENLSFRCNASRAGKGYSELSTSAPIRLEAHGLCYLDPLRCLVRGRGRRR